MKNIFRILANLIFGIRRYNDRVIKNFAKGIKGKKVLELGSGKKLHGDDFYSARRYFDASNDFVQTDIVEEYGHPIVDVTTMTYQDEFDVILCMNVLEHVYDYPTAIDNLHRALKKGGQLAVFVPMYYPLHDEPHDYWRFTEHALQRMFDTKFSRCELEYKGLRQFAVAYFLILTK